MTGAVARIVAATVLLGVGDIVLAQTVPHQGQQRQGIGFGLGQAELAPGGVFEPRVEASVQYVANAELVANGTPQIDMAGLEVAPGFYASRSTDSVVAAIDYSLIGRAWEDSDYDDVAHRLAANGQWIAVPEWFRIRAQAGYGDSIIDPLRGSNINGVGMFGPGNLTEVATASISPVLQHRFNDLEFVAQYDYGRVWYFDEGKGQPVVGFVVNQDSVDQSASISLGTVDQRTRLTARVYYNWQRSEFDTALPYEYEMAGLGAGYRLARTLALVGDIGRESDLDASTTQGGFDSDFWSAGLRWEPSDQTSAEARYGERFFGSSYLFDLRHRARLLEFNASYTEQPTIETGMLSLGDFEPGELPPGLPELGVGRFNSTPFVSKAANASIAAIGSRTRVWVTGFHQQRDYIRGLLGDETRKGAWVSTTRQLASNLSTDLIVSYVDYERGASVVPANLENGSSYDTGVTLRLNRTSGARLTVGGEFGFINRSVGGADIEAWWLALRTRWVF